LNVNREKEQQATVNSSMREALPKKHRIRVSQS
jgi:hypothetical protein